MKGHVEHKQGRPGERVNIQHMKVTLQSYATPVKLDESKLAPDTQKHW